MLELPAHSSNPPSENKVFVSYEVRGNSFIVDFEVECRDLNISENFNLKGWDNTGLWDFDVVEVFIQRKHKDNHYLELQVSPLNQKFALKVKKPREDFDELGELKSAAHAMKIDGGFRAQFVIDMGDIPGESEDLYGNFHACLGVKDKREYYSFELNTDEKPDYHRPDLFQYLGSL